VPTRRDIGCLSFTAFLFLLLILLGSGSVLAFSPSSQETDSLRVKFSPFISVNAFRRVVLSKNFNFKKDLNNFTLPNALTRENRDDPFPLKSGLFSSSPLYK
jgi:hypothetical protein